MARPVKKRKVCSVPDNNEFGPIGSKIDKDRYIKMSIDEFETIRLIDYEGLTQQECSNQMNVARTTVQGIYSSARNKIARALVEGKKLIIEGGHYKLCRGQGMYCNKDRCMEKRDKL